VLYVDGCIGALLKLAALLRWFSWIYGVLVVRKIMFMYEVFRKNDYITSRGIEDWFNDP